MRSTPFGRLAFCLALAMATAWSVDRASTAHGALIVKESFTHPDGPLEGQTPELGGTWAPHSGDGTNDVQVVGGQAKLNQPASGEDIHTDFAGGAIGAGTTVYAAFDLTVPTQAVAPNSVYFAHFNNGATFFASRIFMAPPTTSGYKLGFSGSSAVDTTWGTDLAFGTTYRVVSSYSFDTGAQFMWVNPTSAASPSITTSLGVFSGDAMVNYSLRQSTANSIQLIDNLNVATSFNQALSGVPEPTSLALVSLGLVVAGGIVRRRF